ncbi:tyrosine-type recombinase/integrase [Haloarchaeobius sp. TZWWS8]|uniref:tyrosine-type recombinase/integrase n=1 Tax=Haloarchaeobius sp. TZWWS8 TaxID=3446121 RepID=UPI003EBDA9AD
MTELADALDIYLDDKRRGDADAPGAFSTHGRSVLTRVQAYLAAEHGVTTVEAVDARTLRQLARLWRDCADPDREPRIEQDWWQTDLKASTVENYWAVLRAFLEWTVREGMRDDNPAKTRTAREPLPDASMDASRGAVERQYWPADERERLRRYTRARVSSAYESPLAPPSVRRERVRNHLLVTLLCDTGARIGELVSVSRDSRRNGVTWGDIELPEDESDEAAMWVLGKDQRRNDVPIPSQVRAALELFRRELVSQHGDVPDSWPLLPTRNRPTLSRYAREQLGDDRVERLLDRGMDVEELVITHDVEIPAISTNGARNLMQRLCDDASVDVDGDYLKPHGGRRAIGRDLFIDRPGVATELLRHKSQQTTKESYGGVQRRSVREEVESLRGDSESSESDGLGVSLERLRE